MMIVQWVVWSPKSFSCFLFWFCYPWGVYHNGS